MSDADAAAQENRHLQTAVAHVLHLGDLVDDLADGIEDEIGKHEIDDRPRARHGGPAAQAHKASLADGRVAEALGTVQVVEPGSRFEVSAPFADALPEHENP